MIVVTGATGHTGGEIARHLLSKGKTVRALGRDVSRLADLESQGAQVMEGEPDDPDYLTRAFTGASVVYAMVPPAMTSSDYRGFQQRVAGAQAQALRRAGVKQVVALSSVGAHLAEQGGVVQGLHDMEQLFNAVPGLKACYLRPTYFMENLLSQIPLIQHAGITGSPICADLKLNMVATRDIAAAAVDLLESGAWEAGEVRYLLGARDFTMGEMAGIVGKAVGRPELPYVEIPAEQFRQALVQQAGLSPDVADRMNEFMASLNAGRILEGAARTPQSTTATTLEDFAAQVIAPAYAAMSQHPQG